MEKYLSDEFFNLEISATEYSGKGDDSTFDETIGHIEDMLLNKEFIDMISSFMEKHWSEFENNEENKFVYTDIFNEYTRTVENFIDTFLTSRMKGFKMDNFLSDLQIKKLEMEGEVYEILLSMSDFVMFKEIMLDYRNMKEGSVADFSADIFITSLSK